MRWLGFGIVLGACSSPEPGEVLGANLAIDDEHLYFTTAGLGTENEHAVWRRVRWDLDGE